MAESGGGVLPLGSERSSFAGAEQQLALVTLLFEWSLEAGRRCSNTLQILGQTLLELVGFYD